eukprot:gene11256-12436_t
MNNTTILTATVQPSRGPLQGSLTCHGLNEIHFEVTTSVVITVILTCLINFITGFFAMTSNAVIMKTLWSKEILRTPSNLLLFSMCITDFLVGMIVQMCYVVLRVNELYNIHFCAVKKIYSFFGYLCSGASLMTLSLVTLDRWFAIAKPYRYMSIDVYSMYRKVVVCVWIVWFSYSILPWLYVISSKAYFLSLSVVMLASLGTSAACYVHIYIIIRQHEKNMAGNQSSLVGPGINTFVSQTAENPTNIAIVSAGPNHDAKTPQPMRKAERRCGNPRSDAKTREAMRKADEKRSNTVAVIVAVFLVCYLPKVFVMAVNLAHGNSRLLLFVFGKFTETLVFVNSSLNPIIYCYRIATIRTEVGKTLKSAWVKLRCCAFNAKVTFQASCIEETTVLYDQLAALAPIKLSLSAASPAYRGTLFDLDCRWSIISGSVDDRTREEPGEVLAELVQLRAAFLARSLLKKGLLKSKHIGMSCSTWSRRVQLLREEDDALSQDEDKMGLVSTLVNVVHGYGYNLARLILGLSLYVQGLGRQ